MRILIFFFLITFITLVSAQDNLKFLQENSNINLNTLKLFKIDSPIDGIQPGMGFSSDTDSLAKTVCYQTLSVTRSGQSSVLQFNEAIDYRSILNTFNLEVDLKGGYGIFSANEMYNYMKSVEDDSYSFSINYYQKVSDYVRMTFSYDPDNMLNETGKNIYNQGNNPMFRLLCGDTLISSYEEGAALIISMKVAFKTKEEKVTFENKLGINVGSLISASTSISSTANQYNLNGLIQISAFQMGGDPTQLSKLLASSVVNCDIKNTTACQDTAKGLIDYVSNVFPQQFKKDDQGVWTESLVPLNSFTKDYLVSDIGIKLSPSYVTKEVLDHRQSLIDIFLRLSYYYKSLNTLVERYPFTLSSEYYAILKSLESNLNILYQGDGEQKALDCFTFPFKCNDVYTSLMTQMDNELETKFNILMTSLQFYSIYSFEFRDSICLPDDWQWKGSWTLDVEVYPTGDNNYQAMVRPIDLIVKNLNTTGLNQVNFNAAYPDDIFNWLFSINASQSLEKFIGNFRCTIANPALDQNFKIEGSELTNPFYIPPYKN